MTFFTKEGGLSPHGSGVPCNYCCGRNTSGVHNCCELKLPVGSSKHLSPIPRTLHFMTSPALGSKSGVTPPAQSQKVSSSLVESQIYAPIAARAPNQTLVPAVKRYKVDVCPVLMESEQADRGRVPHQGRAKPRYTQCGAI